MALVRPAIDSTTDSGELVQRARRSTELRSLIAKLGLFRFDFSPKVDVCPSIPPARHNRHTRGKIRADPPWALRRTKSKKPWGAEFNNYSSRIHEEMELIQGRI